MEITRELIENVANVARLDLTEEEKNRFENDFKDILDAFKVLDEADTEGVRSSFRPVEEKNQLRDDEVVASMDHDEAFRDIENKEDGFFIGPRTVE